MDKPKATNKKYFYSNQFFYSKKKFREVFYLKD